ncbi:MAG: TOBE domain-containing protein [Archangium sp.]|nr:TOBE domain-containing protein [Archangium sp.]
MAKISGRNKLPGVVTKVVTDKLMAKVEIDAPGGIKLVAIITRDAAEELRLRKGMKVTALIKATEMMVVAP